MRAAQLRHRIILLIIVGIPFFCFAQKDSLKKLPKIFISVNAGRSFPTGNYGLDNDPGWYQTNEEVPHYSYAEEGYYYNILTGITLGDKWEAQLLLSHITNPVDVYDFVSNAVLGMHVLYPSNGFPISGNTIYSYYNVMPGIARTLKNKYISFDIKVLLGLSFGEITSAQFYVSDNANGKVVQANMNASGYSSFAADFGIGLKVYITPYLMVMVNADEFLSSSGFNIPISFSEPIPVNGNSNMSGVTTSGSHSSIGQANFSFGLGYAFPYLRKK